MSRPSTQILKEKLKDKSHLLYKIQQKHEQWGVPKCALLIGAGCSFPTLPLGSGLVKFCQQLCYIRDTYPVYAADIERAFLLNPSSKILDDFIKDKEGRTKKVQFKDYVSAKESELLVKIRSRKSEELEKIPKSILSPIWADFEAEFLNDSKYGFWLDAYNGSPRERQRFIEALIEGCTPSGAYIILALLIEKSYLNNILTTNFDDFINDTLLYYTSTRPRFYADDEISQYISIYSKKPNIIKLHGDYRYANIKNTNEETLKLTKSMEDKLRELLQNLDLIVIGYNGSDFSIMNVLEKVKSPNCELLWCSLDENNVHWRVANLINNTSNSWFVKIKGFDDIIKDFYLELVNSPPDLVGKAQKRQEEITHYVKAFNQELQQKAETEDEKVTLRKQETNWELMNTAVKEKDSKKKIELLTQIIAQDKNLIDAYRARGIEYVITNEFTKGISDLDFVINHVKNDPTLYGFRGLAQAKLNNSISAISDLNIAIELSPTALYYAGRGVAYFEMKDYDKAIADFIEANKMDKSLEIPYRYLAEIYYIQNKYKDALVQANLALEIDPEYKDIYMIRANIYRKLKQNKNAVKDEKKIAELNIANKG